MTRYLVGIDLGTTNSALAYVDTVEKVLSGRPKLHTFKVPQLVAAAQLGEQPLLPSFLYLPGPHDPPGSVALPWRSDATDAVGQFARVHGTKVPGRLVTSAKSWLCHAGVDRTAPLLPWGAPPDVPKLSPLEVSTRYLRHMIEAWNHTKAKKPEERLEVQQVVITVPASFDDVARNLTAEAAKMAGFQHVSLLEEPQAAFYAWLGTRSAKEASQLKPGMRCLVVDVGGGTSDFSLIRADEAQGELTFLRDAVGDHLLLGGDNMDLALAKAVEAKLPGGRIDAAQFGGLVQACRNAKEAMLVPKPPASFPVTVVGRGRSVVGGTISIPIAPNDVTAAIFEGFFPKVPLDAEPGRANRAGLQEMGLQYVSDAAVSRHLAAFVRQHDGGEAVDAILFNGGVFQPEILRDRLLEILKSWFGPKWKPLVLTSPSLDLAVAWGAAYFAWLKHTGGKRIGGGIPRAYYIGLESNGAEQNVLCVVPRHLEEGRQIELKEPELELTIGRPVLFPLFSSTVRDDPEGTLLTVAGDQLSSLPPLHTVLRGGKRSGQKQVPVTLSAKCTEIGTLELACVTREKNRWKLEFNVREAMDPEAGAEPIREPGLIDVWPEDKVQAALEAIRTTYAPGASRTPPQELTKQLEALLESGRSDWPTGVCRRLWDALHDVAEHRTQGPAYLSRWYNLVGFSLRPGFGDPLDRYRVEALWKLIMATSAAAGKGPAVVEGGADYWIMWRRVAGGLNAALQQNLWAKLRPTLLPSKTKAPIKPNANELAEMWRAAGSLERLDAKTKESLGQELIGQLGRIPAPTYLYWTLTRLGARVLLYGPLNAILHPSVVERWLTELLAYRPSSDHERLGWAFCLAQLARRSGVRAVDVPDDCRDAIAKLLRSLPVPDAWPRMVEEVTVAGGDDRTQMFGDSLPIGLRLGG
jgi:molecular chaperone DnaK (HSP70)